MCIPQRNRQTHSYTRGRHFASSRTQEADWHEYNASYRGVHRSTTCHDRGDDPRHSCTPYAPPAWLAPPALSIRSCFQRAAIVSRCAHNNHISGQGERRAAALRSLQRLLGLPYRSSVGVKEGSGSRSRSIGVGVGELYFSRSRESGSNSLWTGVGVEYIGIK